MPSPLRFAILFTAVAVSLVPVWAGSPPVSCTPLGFRGCNLNSDLIVFGQGVFGGYPIEGRVTSCQSCSALGPPNPAGSFNLSANVQFEFGPYNAALCPANDDLVPLTLTTRRFKAGTNTGGPGRNEPTYVPVDSAEDFIATPTVELRTNCVSANNLDYRIPRLHLIGNSGARTSPVGGTVGTDLVLPESVRAESGTILLSELDLDDARIKQGLTFSHLESFGTTSELRLWPEALPFRLGPKDITYTEDDVTFTTPGSSGGGPEAFRYKFPAGTGASGLTAVQVQSCVDPLGGNCLSNAIANYGYLHHAWWTPSNTHFTKDGMTLGLSLASGFSLLYETVMPARMHVELQAPATITITNGRIADGQFDSGAVYLNGRDRECTGARTPSARKHALRSSASYKPKLDANGSLLAAVLNLNDNLVGTSEDDPINWANNTAELLGCGTLFVPEPVTDVSPSVRWYASAVPITKGRGVYAGINYNKDRVCFSNLGNNRLQKLCRVDADCGALEHCDDGGFSPLCAGLAQPSLPRWKPQVDGEVLSFNIPPADTLNRGREMAFVLRRSGVTGVFDGGDGAFTLGDSDPTRFDMNFDRFGQAYKLDNAEYGDSITQATVDVPWPADTELPLNEASLCKCGRVKQGRPPATLVEGRLGYWDQKFFPTVIRFSDDPIPDCHDGEVMASCGAGTVARSMCVDAIAPVPRFSPDPIGSFGLKPDGTTNNMDLVSGSRFEFDRDEDASFGGTQAPYTVDVEKLYFETWSPGDPTRCEVLGSASPGCAVGSDVKPYGYVDTVAEIALPLFGLTPAGLSIQRQQLTNDNTNEQHMVDAHRHGEVPGSNNSYFTGLRTMAAGSVSVPFSLDYFPPSATSDNTDGDDRPRHGRGTFFAYAKEEDLNLGATNSAAAFIVRPEGPKHEDGDIGAAGALRLWGFTTASQKQRLKTIMPAGHVDNWGPQYEQALSQIGYGGETAFVLPPPAQLADLMLDRGGADTLADHPDANVLFNVDGNAPGDSPPVNGTKLTGYMDISPDQSRVDSFELTYNTNTGGQFYAFDGSFMRVDRHVQDGEQPIITVDRRQTPGASSKMAIPGDKSLDFPAGGNESSSSPIQWDIDYDMPDFRFKSLTGTIDLADGAFSGMLFDRLGAEMKFYADGDWYFTAGMQISFSSGSMYGDGLFGNTKDMTPLREIDPTVAKFLQGIDKFDGAYLRAGATIPLIDFGCVLNASVGAEVGGWKTSQSYGGTLKGWVVAEAACVFSAIGVAQLTGGVVNDSFRWRGDLWAGAGVGFCDEEDWHTPEDVLDDNFCSACVAEVALFGTCNPELEVDWSGPDVSCAL